MITQAIASQPNTVRVTFSIPGSVWADTIHLVGDFNGWNEETLPLKHDGENWTITLELEQGQEYRYRYLFDGHEWRTDSNADRYIPNPHGSYDAVITT
jgi:1,4-alpha-glucan branching enzyme